MENNVLFNSVTEENIIERKALSLKIEVSETVVTESNSSCKSSPPSVSDLETEFGILAQTDFENEADQGGKFGMANSQAVTAVEQDMESLRPFLFSENPDIVDQMDKSEIVALANANQTNLLNEIQELRCQILREKEMRKKMEISQLRLDSEYVDLSESLFEEANSMVVLERKMNHVLNEKIDKLNLVNHELKELLDLKNNEMNTLKESFQAMTTASMNANYSKTDTLSIESIATIKNSSEGTNDLEEHGLTEEFLMAHDPNFMEFKEMYDNELVFLSKYFKKHIYDEIDATIKSCSSSASFIAKRKLFYSILESKLSIEAQLFYEYAECSLCKCEIAGSNSFKMKLAENSKTSELICSSCREQLICLCELISNFKLLDMRLWKASTVKCYLTILNSRKKLAEKRLYPFLSEFHNVKNSTK